MALNFKKIVKALLLALIISIVAVVVLSVAVFFADISDRSISALALILSALSVFVGAFVLAKNIDSGGLWNGLLLGALYMAVLFGASLAAGGDFSASKSAMRCVAVLCGGMLGGALGINAQKK